MTPENEEPHMWRHWRDRKGIKDALRDYFPETLAANEELGYALRDIERAEVTIDNFFRKREEEAADLADV